MARLVVLADAESGLGFRLAGADVVVTQDGTAAAERLRALLADPAVGLVAVGDGLMRRLDAATRRLAETSDHPLVVTLPTGAAVDAEASRRETLFALVERSIGFHITFPGEEERP